jgi:aspartate carbamoyltransferase catalytic subunit
MSNPFYNRDVISVRDFRRDELLDLFKTADRIGELPSDDRLRLCRGRILASLFYEPSTRTKLSFEAAMMWTGGATIGFADPQASSAVKGEKLADTIRVVEGYADLMVLRHPLEGAARFAASVSTKPVINGGSGSEEHPTQAMLDLYTIHREAGGIDGLNIGVLGDLKYGRTVYSLLYGLANFRVVVYLISPPMLKIRPEALYELHGRIRVEELERVEDCIEALDVLYVTRIQRERFPDPREYEQVRGSYRITLDTLKKSKGRLLVMHPLPRVDEISPEVDSTPHAIYFKQAHYGKTVRAALLAMILNEDLPP